MQILSEAHATLSPDQTEHQHDSALSMLPDGATMDPRNIETNDLRHFTPIKNPQMDQSARILTKAAIQNQRAMKYQQLPRDLLHMNCNSRGSMPSQAKEFNQNNSQRERSFNDFPIAAATSTPKQQTISQGTSLGEEL